MIGNLGKDAEVKLNKAGEKFVASFSIATSESFKDKETDAVKTKVEWYKVVVLIKINLIY